MKDTNRINKIKRFNERFDTKNDLLERTIPLPPPPSSKREEKMYNEREVLRMLNNYDREFKLDTFAYTKPCKYTVEDWFERNKK